MRYPSAAFGGGRRAPSDSLAPPPPPARGRAPREPRGARMLVPFPEVGMAFRATEASCSAGDVFLASLASNHVHPPSRGARILEGPRPHHSPARQQHRRRVGAAPILRTVPFRQASHPMNLLPPARRAASLGASFVCRSIRRREHVKKLSSRSPSRSRSSQGPRTAPARLPSRRRRNQELDRREPLDPRPRPIEGRGARRWGRARARARSRGRRRSGPSQA